MKRHVVLLIVSFVALIGLSAYGRTGEGDSTQSAKALNEVVVKGERRVMRGDTMVVFPSNNQRKNNFSGYELLRGLRLPGLRVDAVNGSVSLNGELKTVIQINGRPVEKQDVMALNPRDILRVEYLQESLAEYAYDSNIGAVINFVTRKQVSGYAAALLANNAVTTAYGDNTAYGKYYHKDSEFGVLVNSEYTSLTKRRIDNSDSYLIGDSWHNIDRKGINTPLKYTNTTVQLSYNLYDQKRHLFDVTFKGVFYHSPDRNHKQYVTENGRTPYYQLSQPYEKYLSPSLNLYYRYIFKNGGVIKANLVGVYRDTDYRYYLDESANEDMTSPTSTYGYTTKGDRQAYIAELIYQKRFRREFFIQAGARASYSYTTNKYISENSSKDKIHNTNAYAYAAAYGYLFKNKLYYYGKLGAIGRMYSLNGEHSSKWLFNPSILLIYYLKNWSFRASAVIDQQSPSPSQLVNTEIKTNRFEMVKGNPDLKDWWSYRLNFRINGSLGMISIQNNLTYFNADKPVMGSIYRQPGVNSPIFVSTYANQRRMSSLVETLNIFAPLTSELQLSVGASFRSYQSRGVDYSHNLNNWTVNASVDWAHANWSAGLSWRSKEKSLSGESILGTGAYNNMYVNYVIGNVKIGLIGQHLFYKNGPVYRDELYSHFMTKNERLVVPAHGNMVMLSVAVQLSGGKQRKSAEIDISNDDTESGILKDK